MFEIRHCDVPNANKAADDFIKAVGYRYLDSGAFGSVYSKKDSKFVIKSGQFSKRDGYTKFLMALAKAPANKFFPVIHGVLVFNSVGNWQRANSFGRAHKSRYIVVMERLESAEHTGISSTVLYLEDVSRQIERDLRNTARRGARRGDQVDFKHKYLGFPKEVKNPDTRPQGMPLDLWRALNLTAKLRACDWHSGNVMFRREADGSRQLVITDPVS